MDSVNVWQAEYCSEEAYKVRREFIRKPHDRNLLLKYHQLREDEYKYLVARFLEEDLDQVEPTRSQETQTEGNPWVTDEVSEDDCITVSSGSEGTPSEIDTIILSSDDEDTEDDEDKKESKKQANEDRDAQTPNPLDEDSSSSSDWYNYPDSSDDEDKMRRAAIEIGDCSQM